MKSKLMLRIQQRCCELSKTGIALSGVRLSRVRNLPLLHLMKLSDALDDETIGAANGEAWPSNIVDAILAVSDN